MDGESELEERRRVELGRGIVRDVAVRLARQLGGTVDRSDLESVGDEALVTLLRAYEPKAAPLEPYLRRFLRWAMLDAVRVHRREFPAGRRSRGLAACQWLSAASGDEGAEVKSGTGDDLADLRAALSIRATALVLSGIGASGPREPSTDSNELPERLVARQREREILRAAIASLDDSTSRELLVRHYFGDEPFERIAATLGMSPTQICRRHRDALEELDRMLRREGIDERRTS